MYSCFLNSCIASTLKVIHFTYYDAHCTALAHNLSHNKHVKSVWSGKKENRMHDWNVIE